MSSWPITICGDRAADIEAQLRFLAAEGGRPHRHHRGPATADDMTVQTVADFAGRDLVLDTALEAKIAAIPSLMARFTGVDFEAVMAANRKQAMVPWAPTCSTRSAPRPGWWCPAHRRCWCAWTAAGVAGHVAGRDGQCRGAAGDRRAHGPYHQETVRDLRPSRVGLRRCARPRAWLRASPVWDHHLPAPRRGGDGDPLRAAQRGAYRRLMA